MKEVKKGTLLNSEMSYLVAKLGHTDAIVIADAGLPIPAHVQRIDLALTQGVPTLDQVLNTILSEMVIESMVVANELDLEKRQLYSRIADEAGAEFSVCSHEAFKQRSHQAVAVVRTGEVKAYHNIILYAGVNF